MEQSQPAGLWSRNSRTRWRWFWLPLLAVVLDVVAVFLAAMLAELGHEAVEADRLVGDGSPADKSPCARWRW